jgi:hypothetical protein
MQKFHTFEQKLLPGYKMPHPGEKLVERNRPQAVNELVTLRQGSHTKCFVFGNDLLAALTQTMFHEYVR